MISGRIGTTMTLGFLAILFALVVSIPLGTLAAMRPNSFIDRFALLIAVFGQALPTFWFALMMIILFGVWWRWLPISGNTTWAHFVMPTIALGYYATPALMRLTRAGMIEVLGSDYIRTARAKGLSPAVVLFTHALRNAIIPVVALAAVWFGFMLGGSIVIETIFNLKGIGWLSYDALLRSDLPVVQAIVLIFASFYVVLTLLADLLNAYLDPRISVR
jgi:peptide/nickel transport system permease protein